MERRPFCSSAVRNIQNRNLNICCGSSLEAEFPLRKFCPVFNFMVIGLSLEYNIAKSYIGHFHSRIYANGFPASKLLN